MTHLLQWDGSRNVIRWLTTDPMALTALSESYALKVEVFAVARYDVVLRRQTRSEHMQTCLGCCEPERFLVCCLLRVCSTFLC